MDLYNKIKKLFGLYWVLMYSHTLEWVFQEVATELSHVQKYLSKNNPNRMRKSHSMTTPLPNDLTAECYFVLPAEVARLIDYES